MRTAKRHGNLHSPPLVFAQVEKERTRAYIDCMRVGRYAMCAAMMADEEEAPSKAMEAMKAENQGRLSQQDLDAIMGIITGRAQLS